MSSKGLSPQQARQKAMDQAWKTYQEAQAPARQAYKEALAKIRKDYQEAEAYTCHYLDRTFERTQNKTCKDLISDGEEEEGE